MKYVSGNIYIHVMEELVTAGAVVPEHTHNFDHTTYVLRGAIKIEKIGADGNVIRTIEKSASDKQNWVLIQAEILHRITSLEDGTVAHCVYSHRDDQGQIVQKYTGWDSSAYV